MKKILIAGLGNPGEKYAIFRHNVGARTVEEFETRGIAASGVKIYLPIVFMNESGSALKPLLSRDKISLEKFLVVHDDTDIFFGKLKLSFGSGSAGHRGVDSIIRALGTKNFWRLRMGVQPVKVDSQGGVYAPRHIRADELVLKPFSREEEKELPKIIEGAIEAMGAWVDKNA